MAETLINQNQMEDRPWQKPSDWIDIRSGALPNSVYFLVGHSADFSAYPIFAVKATVSNSGTYDVFVDGIKQATTASGTVTELDWQTLALTSGYDVTYPTALRTHIVRVTPTVSSNTITVIRQAGAAGAHSGTLWVHFTLENRVNIDILLAEESFFDSPLVEAITSVNDELLISTGTSATEGVSGLYGVHSPSLKHLPLLIGEGSEYLCWGYWSLNGCEKLRKLRLKNMTFNTASSSLRGCTSLEKIECDNAYLQMGTTSTSLVNLYKLKQLPPFKYFPNVSNKNYKQGFYLIKAAGLKDTNLDLSVMKDAAHMGVCGSSSYRMDGLKGLTVSNEAPFDSTTSPQLDVSYTGLDRAALVNLFNSMPYNVGYEVVGTPTITDGVVSGFVNQTNYLNASQSLKVSDFKDSEIQFRVATSTAFPVLWMYQNKVVVNIFPSDATLRVRIANASLYSFQLPNSFNTTDFFYYKLMFDSNYTCRFYFGTTAENMTLIEEHSFEVTDESGNYPLRIGGENNNWTLGTVFNGSIDLNNTYIKINGVPWFKGTAAMTKTCSVVGCTGTADLTAADKAIATDKGWSLTVA